MSDFTAAFGAVGNGNSVRGPDLSLRDSLPPSRALLRAASRLRLLVDAGAASRRGPKISSLDFAGDGAGEPGVADPGARSVTGALVVDGTVDDGAAVEVDAGCAGIAFGLTAGGDAMVGADAATGAAVGVIVGATYGTNSRSVFGAAVGAMLAMGGGTTSGSRTSILAGAANSRSIFGAVMVGKSSGVTGGSASGAMGAAGAIGVIDDGNVGGNMGGETGGKTGGT